MKSLDSWELGLLAEALETLDGGFAELPHRRWLPEILARLEAACG